MALDTAHTPDDTPDPSRYKGTAVNPRTFLATDYLNHFNEAIMLIDMVAAVPDCLEDLNAWSPKGYRQHFEESGFKDRALCIEAYRHVAPAARAQLDSVVAQLDAAVIAARDVLRDAVANGADSARLSEIVALATIDLHPLIDAASGIINGKTEVDGDAIDTPDHIDTAQAAVDALFE